MNKLLILPAVLMLMAGCENGKKAPMKHDQNIGYAARIDTITVHGNDHEIIKYDRCIMHSPECWCGKEVAE